MFTVVRREDIGHVSMSIRILVVDDSAPVRDGLRLLLENHPDWEVCGEAVNGLEAIEKHRMLSPDLMVIDVSMPMMNGLDASLVILKRFPGVLILLYTSYLTDQLIEFAHKAGIRGRMSKDTMPLVINALEALLRGEEFSGPAN
jgi:DNA-binding NarL/FixJ family response regulator